MKQVFMRKNPLRQANVLVEEVPVPQCGPSQVLIANRASLISAGTEMASVRRNMKDMVVKAVTNPEIRDSVKDMLLKDGLKKTADRVHYETTKWTPMGYSGCGIAVEVGSEIEDIRQGDLVAYGGQGHAEVIQAAKHLCVRVPDSVTSREASFVALGSIALQAVRRAEVQVGDVVAVLGLGLVGQLVSQLLQSAGARVIGADLIKKRRELAVSLGAEQAFPAAESLPRDVLDYTRGIGADRVVICAATSSSEVIEQAVAMARDRARLVVVGMVGLDIPCEDFYRKELDLVSSRSYGPGRYDPQYEQHGVDYPIGYVRWTEQRNMEEFLRQVQQKRIKLEPLITHEYELAEAAGAYETLADHGSDCLAVVLKYGERLDFDRRPVHVSPPAAVVPTRKSIANVAAIGCGAFARQFHLPNIKASSRLQLRTLVASSAQSAKEMAARFGATQTTTDFRAALTDSEIDAVAIFTRDNDHAPMTIAALEAGKHVFCEKPLATTMDDCRKVAAAARDAGRVCMIGFNRRFAPLIQQVKEVVDECSGPKLVHYRVNAGPLPRDNWVFDPRYAAGRIVGEACHFVDLFCFLIGAEPTSVSAQCLGPSRSLCELQDVAATFHFADGSVANLVYTSVGDAKAGKERLEIFADRMTIQLDDFRQLSVCGKKILNTTNRTADKGHDAELKHFADAVLGVQPPALDYHDGVRATICCLNLYDSIQCSEPVEIQTLDS